MSAELIPMQRYNSDTDTVENFEGSARAEAYRESTITDAPVSGYDPANGINALDNRLAYLTERVEAHRFNPATGQKEYFVSPQQRAAMLGEIAHLTNVVRPYEAARGAELAQRQADNLVERDARLAQEAETREQLDMRAAQIAFEREAEKQADRIAADLRL